MHAHKATVAVDDSVSRASIAAVSRFSTDEFFEIEHWLLLSRSKFQQLLVRSCDVFFFSLISLPRVLCFLLTCTGSCFVYVAKLFFGNSLFFFGKVVFVESFGRIWNSAT